LESAVAILTAAVVVVGVLCLLDLLLTLGVVRRLREHTALLAAGAGAGGQSVSITDLNVGETPAGFEVATVGGPRVSGPAGLRVVAFFSPHCSVCPERVPSFTEYVTSNAIARESVLAVIEGSEGEAPYQATLADVAQVCTGADGDLVSVAFKAQGYPAFCLLDADGALLASGIHPSTLTEPAGV
jgi:hypothetical protein